MADYEISGSDGGCSHIDWFTRDWSEIDFNKDT